MTGRKEAEKAAVMGEGQGKVLDISKKYVFMLSHTNTYFLEVELRGFEPLSENQFPVLLLS